MRFAPGLKPWPSKEKEKSSMAATLGSWRGRRRLFGTGNHLRRKAWNIRRCSLRIQNWLSIRNDKLRNADSGFVGGLAARDFAIGLVLHAVAAIHGHVFFGRCAFVMMARNWTMVGPAAVGCCREPRGAGKGGLQQRDG